MVNKGQSKPMRPAKAAPNATFLVDWSGYIQPLYSETYTSGADQRLLPRPTMTEYGSIIGPTPAGVTRKGK